MCVLGRAALGSWTPGSAGSHPLRPPALHLAGFQQVPEHVFFKGYFLPMGISIFSDFLCNRVLISSKILLNTKAPRTLVTISLSSKKETVVTLLTTAGTLRNFSIRD